MTSLGEKIKTARQKADLTERQLGVKMGFAYPSEAVIRKWENNEREPKIPNILKLAQVLGRTLGYFLKGTPFVQKVEMRRRRPRRKAVSGPSIICYKGN